MNNQTIHELDEAIPLTLKMPQVTLTEGTPTTKKAIMLRLLKTLTMLFGFVPTTRLTSLIPNLHTAV